METANTNEMVHKRLIRFPREQVFAAWTNPELLAQWWGPNGFTNTFHVCDMKPGGEWIYTMHGPDGTDYANKSVFKEIVHPERFVLEHLETVHHFFLIATFEEAENGTLLTFRQVFDTVEECNRVRPYVQEANEQNIDRLEVVVASAN